MYLGPSRLAKSAEVLGTLASCVLAMGVLVASVVLVSVRSVTMWELEVLLVLIIVARLRMGTGLVPRDQGSVPGSGSGQSGSGSGSDQSGFGGDKSMELDIESEM